jgi:D-glutamate cyclase
MSTPQPDTRTVLDRSIGENLDRLITVDMRGDEIGRVVYAAARALTSEPLSIAGARFVMNKLPAEGTALFITGFRIPPAGMPETDGLIGSAVLAFAAVRASAALPVFVCEPEVVPALAAAVRATGLSVVGSVEQARALPLTAAILTFGTNEHDSEATAARLAGAIKPDVCIAIERAGRNAKGHYHFAGGKNVSAAIAPIDSLFVLLSASGVPTLAIGDFGNELGMGAIADVVKAETPAGANCGCGCGGGTACEIPADLTVGCTVSDWGAYALAAAMSHLAADTSVFVTGDVYHRVIEATVAAGAVDGTSRLAVPHIDGVRDDFNARLVEQLRDVVAYPNRRQMDNALRRFRAERLGRQRG